MVRIAHVRSYCDTIFEDQLAGWYREQSRWPVDGTSKPSCLWFDYRAHTLLLDLCDSPLRCDR
jgi:hypothetical protein